MKKSAQKHLATVFVGLACFCALYFISTPKVLANSDHLVIQEVYLNVAADKGKDSNDEWVELYNPTASPIDITNWQITDNKNTRTLTGSSLIVNPAEFALISKSSDTWQFWQIPSPERITFVELGSLIGNGLSNGGDHLIMRDSHGVIVDSLSWGSDKSILEIKEPKKGFSLDRLELGTDTDLAVDFVSRTPSPGREYQRPIYPDGIVISEVLPKPETGTEGEFVELFNTTEREIDLGKWQIDDAVDGSNPFTFPTPTIISPKSFLSFYHPETKIYLNDGGDSVRLLDPNGDTRAAVEYGKARAGWSYASFGNGWQWTKTNTPSLENVLTDREESAPASGESEIQTTLMEVPITQDIVAVRNLPDDEEITVQGQVTTPPGVLSNNYFYLQDQKGAIQIYASNKDFPTLHNGDIIRVHGTLSNSQSDRRLKIKSREDILLVASAPPVSPQAIETNQVVEETEGRYVTIQGNIKETSGDTFIIEGKSEVKVIIRQLTGISKPPMWKGDLVQVSGIVSEYKDEYRVLPFKQEDVIIIKPAREETSAKTLPRAGPKFNQLLIIVAYLGWNILVKVRKRLTVSLKN